MKTQESMRFGFDQDAETAWIPRPLPTQLQSQTELESANARAAGAAPPGQA